MNINIQTTDEAALSKALAQIAQAYFNLYGLKILSANFDWTQTGFGEKHAFLNRVSVDTEMMVTRV